MQNIALLVAIAAPALLVLLLRSNAAVVFLSLCAGAVLVQFAGNEAGLVGSAIGNNSDVVNQYFQFALLVLPAVLSAIFTAKSMSGPKTFFNVLPAIALGIVGVILAVPLLPSGPQDTITSLNGWTLLMNSKEFVVVVGVFVSLASFWMVHPRHHRRRQRRRR